MLASKAWQTTGCDDRAMDLHPEIAAVLADTTVDEEDAPPPVATARADMERDTPGLCGAGEELASVRDVTVPGPAGPVPVRLYRPDVAGPLAVVVHFHGGGWVLGSLDTHDALCRALANAAGALVAAVDYRLAPEHPFPAALEDSLAATRWLLEHAVEHGGDATRLAVVGDSAGGNLAAVVARRMRDHVAYQVLVYPVADGRLATRSYADFAQGWGLTAAGMSHFWRLYLDGGSAQDPDVSPVHATDLAGAPPALVLTADHDVLRDEGIAYAEALRAAGVPVEHREYAGTVHGFWRWIARTGLAREAVQDAAAALRRALG